MGTFGNVGRITVASARREWIDALEERLRTWLSERKWEKAVLLRKKAVRASGKPLVEVTFDPGEYQSNGRRHFKFSRLPSESLEKELTRWLYELE